MQNFVVIQDPSSISTLIVICTKFCIEKYFVKFDIFDSYTQSPKKIQYFLLSFCFLFFVFHPNGLFQTNGNLLSISFSYISTREKHWIKAMVIVVSFRTVSILQKNTKAQTQWKSRSMIERSHLHVETMSMSLWISNKKTQIVRIHGVTFTWFANNCVKSIEIVYKSKFICGDYWFFKYIASY